MITSIHGNLYFIQQLQMIIGSVMAVFYTNDITLELSTIEHFLIEFYIIHSVFHRHSICQSQPIFHNDKATHKPME